MPELLEDDLILYYYGEARNDAEIRRRLAASSADAKRYQELCQLLERVDGLPVPEPHADYSARVWRRLQPQLAPRPAGQRLREWLAAAFAPRRLATAGAFLILLIVAFAAGRFGLTPPEEDPGAPLPETGRERILMVSVGEHLERSKILLIELTNAPGGAGGQLTDELVRAAELLPANRLYRQAALRSGQAGVADVLEELERLLLDVAHSGDLSAADLGDLKQRIEGGGILFRVQVIGANVDRHGLPRQGLPGQGLPSQKSSTLSPDRSGAVQEI